MRRYLRARYLVPAFIALVMIVYGAVNSARSTRANLAEFYEVEHSRQVIDQVQRCVESMLDLETGHRGYVITGQSRFLQPYERARLTLNDQIKTLGELTQDSPTQKSRVEKIRAAAADKQRELAKGIELIKAGDAETARAIVATGAGKEMMDRFREGIDAMRREESLLLAKRQKDLGRSFGDTSTVVVITSVIAIMSGIIGAILLILFLNARGRQERLLFEREKAIQSDRAKTDFLAMMSHEIRTPMNAILGFGELLHDLAEKPQEKHFAKTIVSSGNSLLTLINDILDLSKIEAEKMELRPETVEMRRFVDNLETLFTYRAQEKGLDYRFDLDPDVPAFLSFDALRLRQVLLNLIGNAVKFTHSGHVHAKLRMEAVKGMDRKTLHFEVRDSGIGIAGDQVGQIFRPFYQVESKQGRRFEGTGLGLSISERLVKLMGGRLEVQSHLGKGSIFRVSVPVEGRTGPVPERPADTSERTADFNRLAPARILVVDDAPLNRELIRGYLQGTPHQVLEAENGEQAVALCERHPPDLILMDVRTPVADGASAHGLLKSQESTRKIPLIAVTSSALAGDPEELKGLFDGFASKPVSRERLYLELTKFLPVRTTAATGKPVPEAAPVTDAVHAGEWPDLQRELAELRDSVLPGLIELVPAQATLRFAKELAELAGLHDCPPLAEYASQLEQAAAQMDFAEAGRLLAQLPGLIDSFSHADL
jgi:signal transduction histidine kinase/CheY-like chemotaxis protein